MRTLMKVTLPVEPSNRAIKEGALQKAIQSVVDTYRPEATYFFTEDGQRTAFFFFDMKDSSQMPVLAEPFFMGFNAAVSFCPVMNAMDLKAGLEKLGKNAGKVLVEA